MDMTNTAKLNVAALTGVIISFAQFSIELDNKTRVFLLKELIDVHEKYPIGFLSDDAIEAVNKIIKDIEG